MIYYAFHKDHWERVLEFMHGICALCTYLPFYANDPYLGIY